MVVGLWPHVVPCCRQHRNILKKYSMDRCSQGIQSTETHTQVSGAFGFRKVLHDSVYGTLSTTGTDDECGASDLAGS